MQITELRCSACNGTLKMDENNPNRAVCEYCRAEYVIEWKNNVAHLGTNIPAGQNSPRQEVPRMEYRVPKTQEEQQTSINKGWIPAAALCVVGLVLLTSTPLLDKIGTKEPEVSAEASAEAVAEAVAEQRLPEGMLAAFCEEVFEMPVDDIPESRLKEIKWMETKAAIDYYGIGYSFEDPLESEDAELTWVRFPRDAYHGIDLESLPAFQGLVKLSTSQSLSAEDVAGLKLKSLGGHFESFDEVSALLEAPEELAELSVSGSSFSLQGAGSFPNLERLSIDASEITEEKELVRMSGLKELTFDMYDGSADFSVFGMLPGLESLSVSSKGLRDIGFLSGMTALKELKLENGTFLTLEPLSGRPELESLSVINCDELKDMSAIGGLTNLKSLEADLPYGCPEPDLGGLTGLTSLYLSGFDQTGFLRNMGSLEELVLDGCGLNDSGDFSGLTNLKTLKCTAFTPTEKDYSFIAGLPALENLDFGGMGTYEDISGIFNMPTLKTLNISNMECEINFDKIAENTSLTELSMDHMKLYENVQVSGGGGIYYVDWDDVSLVENLGFLGKFTALQKLSICENELTDLNFASSLPALSEIDFSDNYVTDLTPLLGLRNLKTVTCTDNPISNYEVLSDSVSIIK